MCILERVRYGYEGRVATFEDTVHVPQHSCSQVPCKRSQRTPGPRHSTRDARALLVHRRRTSTWIDVSTYGNEAARAGHALGLRGHIAERQTQTEFWKAVRAAMISAGFADGKGRTHSVAKRIAVQLCSSGAKICAGGRRRCWPRSRAVNGRKAVVTGHGNSRRSSGPSPRRPPTSHDVLWA